MTKKLTFLIIAVVLFFLCDFLIALWLKKGLDNYYGLNQNSEVLLIGHSHLMLSSDKNQMEKDLNMEVSKFCREGVDVSTRKKMIEYYLSLSNKDSLKYVVYGVDLFSFQPRGLAQNTHTQFYPFMDNDIIDSYIKSHDASVPYWSHKLIRSTRYDDALINSAIRGHRNDWSNYKYGTIDIEQVRKGLKRDNRSVAFDSTLVRDLEQTLDLLEKKGIRTVLVNTPTLYELNKANEAGYTRINEYFDSIAATFPNVEYWNLNPQYSQRYDLFFDMIHMNNEGQKVISREITNRIKNLE